MKHEASYTRRLFEGGVLSQDRGGGSTHANYSAHQQVPAFTLDMPRKPLYSIQGGHVSFSMVPFVGPFSVPSDGSWMRVKVARIFKDEPPDDFEENDIVCLYMLYYGDDYMKVGTSRLESAVSRMFSQAPLVAIVVAVIQPDTVLPLEYLERAIIDKLKSPILKRSKPELSRIVSTWNSVISGHGQLYMKLETIKEKMDPLAVLEVEEICKDAWGVAREYGDPLYGFAEHWFIPEYPREPLPPPLPKRVQPREGEEILLKFNPNGLFCVSTRQRTVEGGSAFTCDFNSLSRYGFEVALRE